jgi:hypothetical protein
MGLVRVSRDSQNSRLRARVNEDRKIFCKFFARTAAGILAQRKQRPGANQSGMDARPFPEAHANHTLRALHEIFLYEADNCSTCCGCMHHWISTR